MSKNDVRSHIKRIQKDNEAFVNNPNGQRLINYFTLLNSDPAHFVWEMLQNAEDVRATAISFTLHEKNLYVWHNGSPFTPSNVESICSILLSDKSIVDGQIGKFGAGFKTVFAYTDAPEIYSGDYTFRINNLVSPEYIFKDESVKISPTETLFILPFRNPETAKKDISRKLSQLSTQALMFLKHIEKITITINGISRDILRTVKEDVEIGKYSSFEHIVVTNSKQDKEYYRFTLTGITLKDEDSNGKSFDVLNQSVMIAYSLNQSGKIVPISKSKDINKYFVYFPTEVETHLEFLAHAPFKTTVNRETIYSESSANETLYKKLIELVIISLKYLVKRKIADADFYNQILLPGSVFPTEFPYDILKKKLIKEIGSGAKIIPVLDGGYCKFEELLIESYQNTEKDSVKKAFTVGEIGNTIKAYNHCKYWDSGYFKTNLHKLLRDTKEEYDPGENEINLKKVLDSLTPTWLSGKSLDGVIKLYKLFVNSSHTPSVNFNVIGRERLRTLPLVRTPEGKHITPQNAYWRSSDIHPDLMKNKLCSYFLHDMLQIGEYDAACEIRDVLKSRYGSDKIDVSPDVHLKDIENALSALNSRKMSVFDLANLNIIYAVNAKTNAKVWKKPSEVYLSSENGGDRDAELLLSGVSNIYFTHSMYKPLGNKLELLGLQQPLHVEVMANQQDCGQFVEQQIRDFAEFRKGQIYLFPKENFKPNVQLPYLKEIFASSFNATKSLALYRLLSKNPQYIKGTVEWSTSRTNSSAKTIRHGTLEVYSELGYWLKTKMPWIYSKDNVGTLPVKITCQNVHPDYLKDSALLELFEVPGVHSTKLSAMLPADANVSSEMRELIDATARYSPEELKMVLDNLERPQSIKSIFTSLLEQNNEGVVPDEMEDDDNEFEPTPISNLERRKKSLDDELSKSLNPKKNNKGKEEDPDDWMKNPKVIKLLESASSKDEMLFFKTLGAALGTNLVDYGYTDTTKEERAFLEQEYQGRCQICGARVPKAIKQGSNKFPYHYVARNVIKTRDLDVIYRDSQIVDGWNSLCLCPMCAAKYLYCSKDLSTFADQVLNLTIPPSVKAVYEIKIKLNGKTEVIHYMPKHIYALQRALKFFEAYEKRDAAKREE